VVPKPDRGNVLICRFIFSGGTEVGLDIYSNSNRGVTGASLGLEKVAQVCKRNVQTVSLIA
jgi:hypothetical protein